MKGGRRSGASIEKFLDGLKQKNDDDVAVTTLKGRALSRSGANVHLATTAGIVAVPIANIKEVVSLSDAHADLVRVVVKNPKDIRQLLGVRPAGPLGVGGPGGGGATTIDDMEDGDTENTERNPVTEYQGVWTGTTYDTDTYTGGQGELDATDDRTDPVGHADDEDE
jgi:hypothetical protein